MLKDVILFVVGCFAGKLIEDNLPNLQYKNVWKGVWRFGIWLYISGWITFLRLKGVPSKEIGGVIMFSLAVVVIGHAFAKHRHQLALKKA